MGPGWPKHWAGSHTQDTRMTRLVGGLDVVADGEDKIEHESGVSGSSHQVDNVALK